MKKLKYMEKYGFEQLIFFHDKHTGLKGVTAIHDTRLGPAFGGLRLWNYATEEEAIEDALRLARGMTYKNAVAGLDIGGGKTVIIGDPNVVKNEAYFRAVGRFVQSLNGRYITAEDANIDLDDINIIHKETDFVTGIRGKSGNPSPITAYCVYWGIRASLKEAFGNDEVSGHTFAVQGCGAVGSSVIDLLIKDKAKKIYCADVNEKNIERMKKAHPEVEFVKTDEIFGLNVDVFCPCALGKSINPKTIDMLKVKVVAWCANNQLEEENRDGPELVKRGIVYAPDFIINAGGVINVYEELTCDKWDEEKVKIKVKQIYGRLLEIFAYAKKHNVHPQKAAMKWAEDHMEKIKNVHSILVPNAAKGFR